VQPEQAARDRKIKPDPYSVGVMLIQHRPLIFSMCMRVLRPFDRFGGLEDRDNQTRRLRTQGERTCMAERF